MRSTTHADGHRGPDHFRLHDVPIHTPTFVRGSSPVELPTSVGVRPGTLALYDAAEPAAEFGDTVLDGDEPVATTGTDGPWTWSWEPGGCHGPDERILSPVSRGTEAIALHYDDKPVHGFTYAVDGDVVVVGFDTLRPIAPTGPDPRRLDGFMRPLGPVPGQAAPPHAVPALAENASGLRATPAGEGESRWSGSLLPLPA